MFLAALQSTWWVLREPRIFLLSAATTIGFGLALALAGAPGGAGGIAGAGGTAVPSPALSSTAISAIVLLLIARSWVGLTIAATALRVLRRDRRAPAIAGVSVLHAIAVLVVTVPPVAPIVVGAFLTLAGQVLIALIGSVLIVVGAFWVAAWSQAGMLIIDGRADVMEAGQASVFMTRGFRGEILGIWLLVGAGVAAASWLDARVGAFMGAFSVGPPLAALVHLVLRVGSDAFGTCCVAAVYYELDKTEAQN